MIDRSSYVNLTEYVRPGLDELVRKLLAAGELTEFEACALFTCEFYGDPKLCQPNPKRSNV